MDHKEIEVKYYLKDIGTVRDRILELGAVSLGRVFETNIRYEDEGKTLIQKKQLLRLRHDAKTTLTFKTAPSKHCPTPSGRPKRWPMRQEWPKIH